MALFGLLPSRTVTAPFDSLAITDIARLTGLHRSRVSQLHQSAAGTDPNLLPAPDGRGSTDTRPRWQRSTIERWCAAAGRRLPADQASWLLPGPDGPHLRREQSRTIHLAAPPTHGSPPLLRLDPIGVHIAHYTATETSTSLWLVTPLAPAETVRLLTHLPSWPHGSPLHHLVHELLTDLDTDRPTGRHDDLLGTLVLLPTTRAAHYLPQPADVRLLDLTTADTDPAPGDRTLHDRLRRSHARSDELGDLVTALDHRLPWWPAGCATADLVAAWDPHTTQPLKCRIPPPAAAAWAFAQRCESAAKDLYEPQRTSLIELGVSWWASEATTWHPDARPGPTRLPDDADPAVWQPALEFNLPPAPTPTGEFWEGLEWVLEHSPSQRLADEAFTVYGDPASAGTILIAPGQLPQPVRARLQLITLLPDGHNPASHRARSVTAALDQHPAAATGVRLGHWPAPAGPTWCATTTGTDLVALHVPRRMPAPDELDRHAPAPTTHEDLEWMVETEQAPAPPTPERDRIGNPFELILARCTDPDGTAPAVGFVVTDTDHVLLLPALGDAAALASAIEHIVWHPGKEGLVVGLPRPRSEALVDAVDALLATGASSIAWQRISDLAGGHETTPEACFYCRH